MKLLTDFILVGGLIFNSLILFLLLKKQVRELPQRLLILFFVFTLFVTLSAYANIHDLEVLAMLSFPFDFSVQWVVAPLLFLYIKSLFLPHKELIRKNWIHFLPAFLFILFLAIPILICLNVEECMFLYLKPFLDNEYVLALCRSLYLLVYILLSLRLFARSRSLLKANFSNTSHDFAWVKNMLVGLLVVSCIDVLAMAFVLFIGGLSWDVGYITVISMVILIVYLGYYGLSQSSVLLPDFLLEEKSAPLVKQQKSTTSSSFSAIERTALKDKLDQILEEEKAYLDPDLSLTKLAAFIPISDKKLSTFLNQELQISFYDLINQYRVEAVKSKINAPAFEHYTLLAIALDSGFNSKTSFNRIFKKETGLSPSQFKKQQLEQAA